MNSIVAIHPYKSQGLWVFDDEQVGLLREPFISGADEIIDQMVEGFDEPEKGFTILFSASPFPGYETFFERRGEELGGTWYYSPDTDSEGWLCPALFKYFPAAPERIYARFLPRDAGDGE